MSKEANFNQGSSVEPVLPTVDPSVLAAPEPTSDSSASTAPALTTLEAGTIQAQPAEVTAIATSDPAEAKPAKKPRKPRTKKTTAKAEAIKNRSTKPEPVVLAPAANASQSHGAKLGHTRTNPAVLALLIVSLLVSCASLSYCIWTLSVATRRLPLIIPELTAIALALPKAQSPKSPPKSRRA